jgi:large subunit ribosomal protein L5
MAANKTEIKPQVAPQVQEAKIHSAMIDKYKALRIKWAKEKKHNLEAVPKITKIVITCCAGDFFRDKKAFEGIKQDIRAVALQEPITIKAKKSVSSFTLREGMDLAYKVTLRKQNMMHFLHRLIYCGWLNDRNFYGLSTKAISGNKKGGYSLNFGIRDLSIFPEVPKTLDKLLGLGITVCTTAQTPEDCRELLEGLDIPFSEMKVKEL